MPTGKPSFSWMGIVHRREAASKAGLPYSTQAQPVSVESRRGTV